MMSSYNKRIIPGERARKSARSVSVNDQVSEETEIVAQTVVQKRVEEAMERIRKKEQIILKELEKRKNQVLQEGYETGKEMAVQEAYERLKAEMKEDEQHIQALYSQLEKERRDWEERKKIEMNQEFARKREEICRMAIMISEELIHQQLKTDNESLQVYFEETLKRIEGASKYVYVRMHPLTYEKLKERGYVLYHEKLQIVCDPSLGISDFVVETDRAYLDYSIQTKIRKIEEWILRVIQDVD